ncbi:hypothetical protein [Methylobacter sp. sgz302048]|uniref:hypothetical protein n=1 Tax=Methylobacter sp. sgz302048 TaxID=3455945 RepID=UPI003FA0DA25
MSVIKFPQIEQTNKPSIDFGHRSNIGVDGDFLNLHDTIQPALERAAAMADLIEVACEVADTTSFAPDTLWRAAQAIRFEIKDAQALLEAYATIRKAEVQQ